MRIFFPTAEIPFAGHPTIGCAIHLAEAAAGTGDFERVVMLEEEAGLVPVTEQRKGGVTLAELIAPVLPHAMHAAGVDSAYLYSPGQGCDYQARMFSPTAGIPEDPATGSASAILAAQLLAAGALDAGTTRLTLFQGIEMGRPSRIGLTIVRDGDALREVRVSGGAVSISSGQISAPG